MTSETLNFSFFDCAVPTGDCLAVPPAGGDCARTVSIKILFKIPENYFSLTVSGCSSYTYLEDSSGERFHTFNLFVSSADFSCSRFVVRRHNLLPVPGRKKCSDRPVIRMIANTGRFLRCWCLPCKIHIYKILQRKPPAWAYCVARSGCFLVFVLNSLEKFNIIT